MKTKKCYVSSPKKIKDQSLDIKTMGEVGEDVVCENRKSKVKIDEGKVKKNRKQAKVSLSDKVGEEVVKENGKSKVKLEESEEKKNRKQAKVSLPDTTAEVGDDIESGNEDGKLDEEDILPASENDGNVKKKRKAGNDSLSEPTSVDSEDIDCGNKETEDNLEEDDVLPPTEKDLKVKKKKPGIVYLSNIPRGMVVVDVRNRFGAFGTVLRSFLQPGIPRKQLNKPGKPVKESSLKKRRFYSEGWVEFASKRVAKYVAETLNNKLVGGKKKSKYYYHTWNVKYLPRFKWAHLNERLAYEKAARMQRIRTEVAQAKREASCFARNIEISETIARKKQKGTYEDDTRVAEFALPKQRRKRVEEEVKEDKQDRESFLTDLFG